MQTKFILFLLLVVSCNQNTSNIKITNNKSSFDVKTFTQTLSKNTKKCDTCYLETTIINNEYSLIVKTRVVNITLSENYIFNFDNVIEQKLLFFHNNKLLKEIVYSPLFLNAETVNGNEIMLLENVLYRVSIVRNNDNWIYQIFGGGITASQTEYVGLFTPEGNIIWYQYLSSTVPILRSVPNEMSGDIDSALKKHNITTNELLNPYIVKKINL